MNKKLIELYFPVHKVNELANKESTGFGRRWYRPIYTMHKWWARRLGTVFRSIILYSLIEKGTKVFLSNKEECTEIVDLNDYKDIWKRWYYRDLKFKDKIILDPFFGGGTTIIESLRLGCNVIGKELNPVAWFVTKKEVEPVSIKKLEAHFKNFDQTLSSEILPYYMTICPECNEKIEACYYFWVKKLNCINCEKQVLLFNNYRLGKMQSINVEHKKLIICTKCNSAYMPKEGSNCPYCGSSFNHEEYYFVICPQCFKIFGSSVFNKPNNCPYCKNSFNPNNGNVKGQYYICQNGHKRKILENIDRGGKLNEDLYAISYYCKYCDKVGYKKVEQFDIDLFKKAKEEFIDKKSFLPIPKQKIPDGYNTKQMKNHGYEYFFEMFNERQLLNLGKLFQKILEIKDYNIKEFYLLAFSNSLKYNNMFCKFNKSHNFITDIFRTHTYHPSICPVESNSYKLSKGMGSFTSFFDLIIEGKNFNYNPHEYKLISKKKKNIKINTFSPFYAEVAYNNDQIENKKSVLLFNGSSEFIDIPNKYIDAIITDPPYYDNVMYSELSDFFYVWLREGLKKKYPFFQAELSPKRAEVIKNKYQKKGDMEYISGMIKVFSECYNKLKDDGIIVFTFHHKGKDAWIAILNTILNSNFYVSAVYPIQAEMKTSTHILGKANIEYDMIIICRKRLKDSRRVEWHNLQDEIFLLVEESINSIEKSNNITEGDKFVIAMGKCLEVYSRNWPNVYNKSDKVTIEIAINDIKNIVGSYFNKTRFATLEKESDRITAIYIQFFYEEKDLNFNEINKAFQQRNIDINDVLEKELIIKQGNKIKILTNKERKDYLETLSKEKMSAIDQAHYILNLKEAGNLTKEDLTWVKDSAIYTLKRMNFKDSDRLINYIEKNKKQKQLG